MKCEVCKRSLQETFLKKLMGTYVKDAKGKKHIVCQSCQKLGKEELLRKL